MKQTRFIAKVWQKYSIEIMFKKIYKHFSFDKHFLLGTSSSHFWRYDENNCPTTKKKKPQKTVPFNLHTLDIREAVRNTQRNSCALTTHRNEGVIQLKRKTFAAIRNLQPEPTGPPIDRTLSGNTPPYLNGPDSYGKEGVLHIP